MQKAIIAGAFAIAVATIASFAAGGAKMKITSSAFQEGATIPSKFTCDSADASPPLQIADIPSEAKSLALIVDDPDAPSGLFWLRRTVSALWNASLLLQDFRARPRAGFTLRRKTGPAGCGDERSRRSAR